MVASLEAILASTVSTNHTYCHEFNECGKGLRVAPARMGVDSASLDQIVKTTYFQVKDQVASSLHVYSND
jgi:hypothetical protein